MATDDSPICNAKSFVITTDDGTTFACVRNETAGVLFPRKRYWSITDERGLTYVGPLYIRDETQESMQRTVSERWETKKALGQEGVNAEKMLGWLREGR